MHRILIITYDMPPYSATWGGAQRMFYLANYLTRKGEYVEAIAFDKGIFCKDYECQPLFDIVGYSLCRINQSNNINNISKKNINTEISAIKKGVKALINIFFNENSSTTALNTFLWIKRNKAEILKKIEKEKFDVVIVSIPPFAMSSILKYIRKRFGDTRRIILDYRDPWNLWHKGNRITLYREKQALYMADEVVCTTSNLAADMVKLFSIPPQRVHVVANGYSNESWENTHNDPLQNETGILKISYIGSINFVQQSEFRDITKFLNALDKFLLEEKRICVKLIGVNDVDAVDLKKIYAKYGENLKLYGAVSVEESLRYMQETDVLLLLHTSTDRSAHYIVSAKLYDYLRANRFIFSISNKDSNHAAIIDERRVGINVENEEDQIYNGLKEIFYLWENRKLELKQPKDLEQYSREFQNNLYYTIICGSKNQC